MSLRKEKLKKESVHEQIDFSYEHLGLLHVPPDEIPDDSFYLWVVESIRGVPDSKNIEEALRKGGRPVPPERHPSLMPPADLGGPFKDMDRTAIRKGGQILFEFPKSVRNKFLKQQEMIAKAQLMEAKDATRGMDDPMDGVHFSNELSVLYGG